MQLSEAFRRAIEAVGLEQVNQKRFWNIVKDLYNVKTAYSFLWYTLVQQKVIDSFLELHDSDDEMNRYINKISYITGFDLENLQSLLSSLREGILCSYYGIFPNRNSFLKLRTIYINNKTRWQKRIDELKDGIIIARKDNKYGVLSLRKEILPFIYRGATKFSDGLACFNDGSTFGFINYLGNMEIDLGHLAEGCPLSAVGHFSNGIAKLYGRNSKVGFLSLSGKHTDLIFDDYGSMSTNDYFGKKSSNLYLIRKDRKIGVMNNDCDIIVAPQFEEIYDYNSEDKSLFAKNVEKEWCLIKEDGKILSIDLKNPSVIAPGIIQDINISRNIVKFRFYNTSLHRITNLDVDHVTYSDNSPILIHSRDGIYYFLNNKGIVFDSMGYEKAFPFISDFTWVKVGIEWRRINKNGDYVTVMKDGEILTKEISDKVLRRNKDTSLIEVYNCCEDVIERIIPNSSCTVISETYGRISALNYSQFQIDGKFYVWSEGGLIESSYPINRVNNSKRKLFISKLNEISFRLLCDGKCLGPFTKKNFKDKFVSMFSLDNRDEIIYYKTEEGNWYLFNINTNKYSEHFSSIEMMSVKNRAAKSIIVKNLYGKSILINSNFDILAEWDKIEITSSKDYFRIIHESKYGLISFSGETIIEPIYESLSYYSFP